MLMVKSDSLIKRRTDIAGRQYDQEAVLIQCTEAEFVTLNPVGAFVWQCLEQPQSLDALVQAVVSDFQVESQQAQNDVQNFVQELVDASFVEVEEVPA